MDAPVPVQTPYPPKTANFHHEIELAAAIGQGDGGIAEDNAPNVHGYVVGLDMTRRDLQLEARVSGRPWEFNPLGRHHGHCTPLSDSPSLSQ